MMVIDSASAANARRLAEVISTPPERRHANLTGWAALGARIASHRTSQRLTPGLVGARSGLGLKRVLAIELGTTVPSDFEVELVALAVEVHDPSALIEQAREIRKGA